MRICLFSLNRILQCNNNYYNSGSSSAIQQRSCFLSDIKLVFYIAVVFVCCCHNTAFSIYLQPSSRDIGIWTGDKVFVTCFRHPNETEGTLRWIDPKGNEVRELFNEPVYADHNPSSVNLFFIDARKSDSGRYKCQHSLSEREIISTIDFNLHVYNSIDTHGNYDKITVSEGETLSVKCIMRFDSDSTDSQINWLYGNSNIDRKHITEKILKNTGQNGVKIQSTLTLKNVPKDKAGEYICRGSTLNQYLTDIKQVSIYVRIRFAPYFAKTDANVIDVWISDRKIDSQPLTVNIECRVHSDPMAEFIWSFGYRHGFPIDMYPIENKKIVYKTQELNLTQGNTENVNVLTLSYESLNQINETHQYFGSLNQFKCQALNMLGSNQMFYEIKLGQSPLIPKIVEYKYRNGMLRITLNETEIVPPIDLYKLELSDGYAIYFNKTHALNNEGTYQIAADIPEGQHNLNIYAHNSIGWSQPPVVNYFFAVKLVSQSTTLKNCFTLTTFSVLLYLFVCVVN